MRIELQFLLANPDKALDTLLPLIKRATGVSRVSWCFTHNKHCEWPQAKRHVCTFSCTSHSTQGSRKRSADHTMVYIGLWALQRAVVEEPILCLENVPGITYLLQLLLGHLYNFDDNTTYDIQELDWPVARNRYYCIAVHNSYDMRCPLYTPLSDFVQQFFVGLRNCWQMLFYMHLEDASSMTVIDDELRRDLQWAKDRPSSLANLPDAMNDFVGATMSPDNVSPFLAGINHMESLHLSGYRELWPNHCYSLMQNPWDHPSKSHGRSLQCIIKSTGLYWADQSALQAGDAKTQSYHTRSLSRHMMGSEFLTGQGFRVRPQDTTHLGYTQSSFNIPCSARCGQHVKSQAGNAVNINAMGLLMLASYCHYGQRTVADQFDDPFLKAFSMAIAQHRR